MSTYDGAYTKRNSEKGAKICCCKEDSVNNFCTYHGKYGDGSFKQSEEHKQLVVKIAEQYVATTTLKTYI